MITTVRVSTKLRAVHIASRPDFVPVTSAWRSSYRRTRQVEGETCYDIIAMSSSQKHRFFDASAAWGIFPTWEGSLGIHEIRAGRGLAYLCGRSTLVEQVYEHDGSEEGAREALRSISRDLAEVAEPWFDQLTQAALTHPLVVLGLEWIRAQPEAKVAKQGYGYEEVTREELGRVLRRRARELDLHPSVKKNISLLTYHLLEFASDVEARR